MKTSKRKSLTKLVNTVFDRIYNNVIIEKNSDYNTIAEMMGDKVRGAYSHMQNESHCGCSKKSKETADEEEFEMQLKNKKKLTESIIKKFRFGSK